MNDYWLRNDFSLVFVMLESFGFFRTVGFHRNITYLILISLLLIFCAN